MPELRQNFATKEWVIIATERAERPQEMVRQHPPRTQRSFSPKCPFCPGNQATTPPGVMRVPATGNGAWTV
jgi:UDPglucose--hexose-1-phosphate uridylyltransferase